MSRMHLRYLSLFLILSACAPMPVDRGSSNQLSELDRITSKEAVTPRQKRQLLLSTPYVIELIPDFEGYEFSKSRKGPGTDINECIDSALNIEINHTQFVLDFIKEKEDSAARAGDVVAVGAGAVGIGAIGAGIMAIAIMGPIASSLGASSGVISSLASTAATSAASSLATTIGPLVLLGAIATESDRASIDERVAADNSIKAFVLKSYVIKCLTEKKYFFDVYSALMVSDDSNIYDLSYEEAEKFFEIYGDLAAAEYLVIRDDYDPYEVIKSDLYYMMSEDEKNSLVSYLEYLKAEKKPLRLMNKEVALEARKSLDDEAFVYWDPLTYRFYFTK